MHTIHFSDEYEQSVQGSSWALMLYQREFAENGKKADFYNDWIEYLKGVEGVDEDGNKIPVYVDVAFLLKVGWAMAKNLDDDLPDFKTWARTSDIVLEPNAPWMTEVQTAIFADIFRKRPKKKKTTRKEAAGRRTDGRKTDSGS